jgi:hypothetical protein
MNNSIINNYLKNHKILYAAALAASLVYCIAMTSMGITKFYRAFYINSGSKAGMISNPRRDRRA